MNRELLGMAVRETWVARQQKKPDVGPRDYELWEEMSEFDRETDRLIGESVLASLMMNDNYPLPFEAYQRGAKLTAVYPGQGNVAGLAYVILGLTGEAGEIANKVKKILRDDRGFVTKERRVAILKEAGDCLWYLAQLATELNADFGDVASDNIKELRDRKERGTLKGDGDAR